MHPRHPNIMVCLVPVLAALALGTPSLIGEEKNEVSTTVEQAGPDYAIQGEYDGLFLGTTDKIGVQVIALGAGNFRACFEPGGLPGDGSDGKTGKIEVEAKRGDAAVQFAGHGFQAELAKEQIVGSDDKGRKFQAKRVLRQSPTLGAKPPAGATVLFDGSGTDQWEGGMDERKLLKYGAKSKGRFTDFTLHLEFMLPFKPYARGQERGNSGVYLQHRYEVQVLDSFGLKGENNEAGGIYTIAAPKFNMCFPPLTWQTYDIDFEAARWTDGTKTKPAVATVKHNGVLIQDHTDIPHPTGGAGMPDNAEPGPIYLQDHGNPVFYRNIWILEKK